MYISTTDNFIGEALRNALRTDYEKLSCTSRVKCATGEVPGDVYAQEGEIRRGWQRVRSTIHRKGPKYFTVINVRSYATRGKNQKLAPVVELDKDFEVVAKH